MTYNNPYNVLDEPEDTSPTPITNNKRRKLEKKLRQIEPSKESKKFIIPNMRPFDAIKLIMPQAISSIGQESTNTYMFWESKQGYHFRSLNSIINGSSAFLEKDENIMPVIIDAVKSHATLGEISDTLRKVFGEYKGY